MQEEGERWWLCASVVLWDDYFCVLLPLRACFSVDNKTPPLGSGATWPWIIIQSVITTPAALLNMFF